MNGIATLTQRGQIVIPQPIRELLDLKSSDKLSFAVRKNKIVVSPILSLNEAAGMIKTKKVVSKKEYKKTIAKGVIKKFEK